MSDLKERLRATWPLIEAGPVTTAQRQFVHEAVDRLEAMEGLLQAVYPQLVVQSVRSRDEDEVKDLDDLIARIDTLLNNQKEA